MHFPKLLFYFHKYINDLIFLEVLSDEIAVDDLEPEVISSLGSEVIGGSWTWLILLFFIINWSCDWLITSSMLTNIVFFPIPAVVSEEALTKVAHSIRVVKADIWTVLSLATDLRRMGKDGTLHWTPWFWLLSLSQYLDMMDNLKIQLQARPKALPNCEESFLYNIDISISVFAILDFDLSFDLNT